MSKTRHNTTFAAIFFYAVMLALGIALVLGIASCNTTKQADRHFYKALSLSQPQTGKNCSIAFPPVEATKDSFIYIQGEDIVTHDTIQGNEYYLVDDTVVKYKYITKTIRVTDTLRLTSNTVKVDRAKEMYLQATLDKNIATIAKQKKALSISLWANGLLALAVIIWVIKKIWFK